MERYRRSQRKNLGLKRRTPDRKDSIGSNRLREVILAFRASPYRGLRAARPSRLLPDNKPKRQAHWQQRTKHWRGFASPVARLKRLITGATQFGARQHVTSV